MTISVYSSPPRHPIPGRSWWASRRAHKALVREQRVIASRLAQRWAETAYGANLGRDTTSAAGVGGISIPQVTAVALEPTPRLTVRLRAGQTPEDLIKAALRLAYGLGVPSIRITPRAHGYVKIELVTTDPLAVPVYASPAADPIVVLGRADTGEIMSVNLADVTHVIVQGQTRSGKSRFVYGFLGQLVKCPTVRISGSDITGLLLRPFASTRHVEHQALGTANLARHAEVLENLVGEMERRLARMPAHLDVLPITESDPYELVVIEELASLLKAAAVHDASLPKNAPAGSKLVPRIEAARFRLMVEGAKVGIRVMLIIQRAEAGFVGGFERDQASLRLTFPVEDPGSVKMLHPAAEDHQVSAHMISPAGRALISGPGLPLMRLRSPQVESYVEYVERVTGR